MMMKESHLGIVAGPERLARVQVFIALGFSIDESVDLAFDGVVKA